jgi:hypothetical protein
VSSAPVAKVPVSLLVVAMAIAVTGFLGTALDGRMYWHEGRLLYAVTYFSLGELTAGAFNPNELGHASAPHAAGGFHLSKILYLAGLRALADLPFSADVALQIGIWLSLLAVVASAFCVRGVALAWQMPRAVASWSAAACLLLPTVPYLAGKLLSEAFALLPAFLAAWLWSIACHRHGWNSRRLAVTAGLLVTTTALIRLDIAVMHLAFAAASILSAQRYQRSRLIAVHAVVLGVAAAAYAAALLSFGANPASILAYLDGYLGLSPKSLAVSILAVACHGGLAWLLVGVGIAVDTPQRKLMILWLVLATLPIVLIVLNFMVEPRYLAVSILPMAILAGTGIQRLLNRARSGRARNALVLALAAVPAANAIPIALMPYELDRPALLQAVDRYQEPAGQPAVTFLVPWAYSDFHFLRYARPTVRTMNVHSPGGDPLERNGYWDLRVRAWYGHRYVTETAEVDALLELGPVFYVGWGQYPPLATVARQAERIGLGAVSRQLRSLGFMDHRVQSWLWDHPGYGLRPDSHHGQYTLYRVESRLPP